MFETRQKTKIELENPAGRILVLQGFESVQIECSIDTKIKQATVSTSTLSKTDIEMFGLGSELRVYTGKINQEMQLVYVGVLNEKIKTLEGVQTFYEISSCDYLIKTQQIIINESFTNYKLTDIISSLMAKYLPNIAIKEIEESDYVIARINFKNTFLYSALERLCSVLDYTFSIDTDKHVSFFSIQSKIATTVFKKDMFVKGTASFTEDFSLMVNKLHVQGGTQLSNNARYQLNDPNKTTVYNLPYKPRGAIIAGKTEGVYIAFRTTNATTGAVTETYESVGIEGIHTKGFKALLNYNEKTLKMINATTGDEQPYLNRVLASNERIDLIYRFETPINIELKKIDSIEKYGQFDDILNLSHINDRELVKMKAYEHLNRYATPVLTGSFDTWLFEGYEIGENVKIEIETDGDFVVNDMLLLGRKGILIAPNTIQCSLSFQEKSKLSTVIKSILERIKDMEEDMQNDEVVEKIESFEDTLQLTEDMRIINKNPSIMRIGGILGGQL